jgi:hypothetical protein
VKSCCEFGNEASGSMKCWETIEGHSPSLHVLNAYVFTGSTTFSGRLFHPSNTASTKNNIKC